jgi:hypothetical protein
MAKTAVIKLRQYEGFGGNFVDSDYLVNSYDGGHPHVFEGIMGKIFSSTNRFSNKSLLGMTLAKGKVKEIDNETYRWYLAGSEEKSVRSVEDMEPANLTKGLNLEAFKIKVDEGWFTPSDVLMAEDNQYAMRVYEGPIADGNGYVYLVKLQTDDPTKFLPNTYVEVGRQLNKSWTATQFEFNTEFGSTYFPSPTFQLESQIGSFGQSVMITDKALREGGRLGLPFTVDGKKGENFIPYAEAKVKDELYTSVEVAMKFGERATMKGKDGRPIKQGPGYRHQMRDSHQEYYNGVLTENRLKDYLMSIFFARVNEGNRKIVAITGTGGSMIFHDMLAASASSFFTLDTHFIQKVSDNPRHLSYGAQFTHYQGPEGIEVTLIKDPMYDDLQYCRRTHPVYTDMPIDSFRFDFLDFGTSDGEDNIQMLKLKGFDRHGYIPGSVGPMGPIQGGMTTSKVAGYESFCETSGGLFIKDITRCGSLIYDYED